MTSKFRKTVDWDAMLPDWVAGIKSVLQLSEEYSVSRAAILKHWSKLGIERDLAGKIKAKADALVTRALVTQEVTSRVSVTETEIIEANARNSADIQIAEKKDVSKARSVVMKLVDELNHQVNNPALYEKLGEIMQDGSDASAKKMEEIYKKVISFGGRVNNTKTLLDSMKTSIDLERRVNKIDDESSSEPGSRVTVKVNFVDANQRG